MSAPVTNPVVATVLPVGESDVLTRSLESARNALRSAWWCMLESRPAVQVMFILRFAGGTAMRPAGFRSVPVAALAVGVLAWFCAALFVYLYNGACDVVEDRGSAKGRPIARGRLDQRQAKRIAIGLACASLVIGLDDGVGFDAIDAAFLLVGYLYSAPWIALKRHCLSAAAIAMAGGVLTIAGGYMVAGGSAPDAPVLTFGLVAAAWMGCVGSVAKDFSDTEGDAAAGRRSLVLLLGRKSAGRIVALCAILVAGLFSAVAWTSVPLLRPASVVLALGALAVAGLALRPGSATAAARARDPYRAFMIAQYAATLAALAA